MKKVIEDRTVRHEAASKTVVIRGSKVTMSIQHYLALLAELEAVLDSRANSTTEPQSERDQQRVSEVRPVAATPVVLH